MIPCRPQAGIAAIFKENRCAFIPYLMAGDPDVETTHLLMRALAEMGADAIELGIPFGDPLADGPTIAAAASRALRGGVGIAQVLALVREARTFAPPIVLFAYFNPVYQYGIERFAADAAQAGAAGVIVPDVTIEEGEALRRALDVRCLAMPLLVAPSTSRERAARIAERSSGFVYVVSRLGVTGAADVPDLRPLQLQLEMLRETTRKPLAVGFGISKPEHVRAVREHVDGFIVGSALIDAYAGKRGYAAVRCVRAFVGTLVPASLHDRGSGSQAETSIRVVGDIRSNGEGGGCRG